MSPSHYFLNIVALQPDWLFTLYTYSQTDKVCVLLLPYLAFLTLSSSNACRMFVIRNPLIFQKFFPLMNFSESALADADVLLYVTDVVETPDKHNDFVEKVGKLDVPVLLLINKIDLSNQEALVKCVEEWHELIPQAEIIPISAISKFGVDVVMKRIKDLLPDSPPYFDKDQWTDKPARFFVTEIIREKILLYYDKEIPYAVEVVVEQFKEDAKSIHINAVIYVERDSQKGIIIGKQGKALKKVSTEARKTLEKFFQKSIYLETFVKVDKDWRSSDKELKNFGYQLD